MTIVLNTRPREQAAELSALLRAAGYTPLEAPAIETSAAWDERELAHVLGGLRADAYAWVVFSSRNAVRFFLDGLAAAGGNAADLGQARLLAGSGTAEALREAGLAPTRILERFSAEAALAVLRHELAPGERVLVPRAAEGREELLDGLRQVDAPICYRTQAVPAATLRAVDLGQVRAITLTSPSAAQSVAQALGTRHAAARVVCLGATTAQAARAAGLHVDRVAERTDLPSLVEAVTAALNLREVTV
jgi:uroporphyrinogen-III synthase